MNWKTSTWRAIIEKLEEELPSFERGLKFGFCFLVVYSWVTACLTLSVLFSMKITVWVIMTVLWLFSNLMCLPVLKCSFPLTWAPGAKILFCISKFSMKLETEERRKGHETRVRLMLEKQEMSKREGRKSIWSIRHEQQESREWNFGYKEKVWKVV